MTSGKFPASLFAGGAASSPLGREGRVQGRVRKLFGLHWLVLQVKVDLHVI